MLCYLAIDIGASGGRHIVGFLADGRIETKEVYRFENGMQEKDGHLTWNAEQLFAHVLEGMKACHEQGYTPVTMGIDTWGVDYMLLDAENHPLGDMMAYRDSRSAGLDRVLEETLPFSEMYRITGTAKQPFLTVYQLMADLKDHPAYRTRAADFLLVPEYLNFRLCGIKAHEQTMASTTAMMDIRTNQWSEEIRKAADLPSSLFQTPICKPGTCLGPLLPKIQQQVGFNTTVMLPAAHDTASAFMAVPVRDEHAVFLSSGTWSLLGLELNAPLTDEACRLSGFTNEGGWNGSIRYLRNIMGMWMLQCIRREMGKTHSYAQMAQMAADSAYPAWVDVTDPRFLAPACMIDAVKAALQEKGASAPAGIDDLLRAVTVGLAVCYQNSIRALEKQTGKPFTAIHIVGGGCQNETLNSLTASLTSLPVYAGPTEGTALGNLGAQMIAGGEIASLDLFREILKKSIDIRQF